MHPARACSPGPKRVARETAQRARQGPLGFMAQTAPQPEPESAADRSDPKAYEKAWMKWARDWNRWVTLERLAKGVDKEDDGLAQPHLLSEATKAAKHLARIGCGPDYPDEDDYPPRPRGPCPCQKCGGWVYTDQAGKLKDCGPGMGLTTFCGHNWWTCCCGCGQTTRWARPSCPEAALWREFPRRSGWWRCPNCTPAHDISKPQDLLRHHAAESNQLLCLPLA